MRFQLHLTAATLLVAIGIGGMTSAKAADREARAAVMGRQQILDELSATLAKGYLTRMEQYRILLHAKEVLTDDDLHGLEQTLDRIATRQATIRPDKVPVRSKALVQQRTDVDEPGTITPSKYEEPNTAEIPAGDSGRKKAKALSDGPFVEEVPSGIGQPAIHLDSDDPEGFGCDQEACHPRRRWLNANFISSIDAFKGPVDLNSSSNFGTRLGVNAAVPILPRMGVALQAGTSVVLSNLKGSNWPQLNSKIRDQVFTTVGMFQRINSEEGTFTWGFAYDWLFDDYYSNFHFGQWRVKAAYESDPCNEFGIQASLPEHGSTGSIPNFDSFGSTDVLSFKPITQGYLYWKHTWSNDASLTGRFGMAERPGEFVFGTESRVPLTKNLALTSDFSYIMPSAGGGPNASLERSGQAQEIWNVSVGIEIVLGGNHGCATRFQPFLPVADNGSLAARISGEEIVPPLPPSI